MKFFRIKQGDLFYIEEKSGPKDNQRVQRTLCKKVSALGYTMAGEEVLGEHSIEPHTDSKIVFYTPPAAAVTVPATTPAKTPVKVAAKKAAAKKSPAKKSAAKKTAKKK